MNEYTPTTDHVRQVYSTGSTNMQIGHLQAAFDRWLAAHDAEVRADEAAQWAQAVIDSGKQGERIGAARAGVVAEEPEWEYGACYQGDNGRELLWFSMGNSGFAIREAAEKEVERYTDAQIRLCRRRKAGPWEPVN